MEQTTNAQLEPYDWGDDPTAQDVIEAMRLAVANQVDAGAAIAIVRTLLDYAPETASDRGISLLMRLLSEGTFKVEMT